MRVVKDQAYTADELQTLSIDTATAAKQKEAQRAVRKRRATINKASIPCVMCKTNNWRVKITKEEVLCLSGIFPY